MKLLEWLTGKPPITMKLPETGKRSAKRDFEDFMEELEVNLREVDRLLAELDRRRWELKGGPRVYRTRWWKFQSYLIRFHESQVCFERHRMFLRRFHFGEDQADIKTMAFRTVPFHETWKLEKCQGYLRGCRREWELFLREFSGIDLSCDELKHSYFFDLLAMESHMLDMELWDRDFRDEQRSLESLQKQIEIYQMKREELLVFYKKKKREYESQFLVFYKKRQREYDYEARMREIEEVKDMFRDDEDMFHDDEVEDVFHDALDRGIDEVEDVFHDAEAEF